MRLSLDRRIIHDDCRHYRGSRPCEPHKREGVVCSSCPHYDPIATTVAIVKLGAMGDVLRTTALLSDVEREHPGAEITWFTLPASVPLLTGNRSIARVVADFSSATIPRAFDVVYSLDNAEEGVRLAHALEAKTYRGFRLGAHGKCDGVHTGGDDRLFQLGLWDDLKRENREPYLDMLARSAGLSYSGSRPVMPLGPDDDEWAAGVVPGTGITLAINLDAGKRWKRKQWNIDYTVDLARRAVRDGFNVLLLGGNEIAAVNEKVSALVDNAPRVVNTDGFPGRLAAVIARCDVLLSGDTLAMHIAWAMQTPVVALFGPTSLDEITLGTHDIKLSTSDLSCLGCYLQTCDVSPNCMDLLTPNFVYDALLRRLHRSSDPRFENGSANITLERAGEIRK